MNTLAKNIVEINWKNILDRGELSSDYYVRDEKMERCI